MRLDFTAVVSNKAFEKCQVWRRLLETIVYVDQYCSKRSSILLLSTQNGKCTTFDVRLVYNMLA